MVGFDEVVLIAIVALLLFGPDKMPQYLRELGKLYAEFRKAQRDLERELSGDPLVSRPVVKPVSPTVIEIAGKLGIATDGKTEEQLLAEIEAAVPQRHKENEGTKAEAVAEPKV